MPLAWTAEAVARMHMARITAGQLAEEAGYTPQYLSMVMRGRRQSEKAKHAILAALARLEAQNLLTEEDHRCRQ